MLEELIVEVKLEICGALVVETKLELRGTLNVLLEEDVTTENVLGCSVAEPDVLLL